MKRFVVVTTIVCLLLLALVPATSAQWVKGYKASGLYAKVM